MTWQKRVGYLPSPHAVCDNFSGKTDEKVFSDGAINISRDKTLIATRMSTGESSGDVPTKSLTREVRCSLTVYPTA